VARSTGDQRGPVREVVELVEGNCTEHKGDSVFACEEDGELAFERGQKPPLQILQR